MAERVLAALHECQGHANTDRIAYLSDIPVDNCQKYLNLLKNDSKVRCRYL